MKNFLNCPKLVIFECLVKMNFCDMKKLKIFVQNKDYNFCIAFAPIVQAVIECIIGNGLGYLIGGKNSGILVVVVKIGVGYDHYWD
jgi:hypothetical protein